jgi:hypothetical protein
LPTLTFGTVSPHSAFFSPLMTYSSPDPLLTFPLPDSLMAIPLLDI